jgi:acetylornithine deacetylase/succinyl-diaminopimelate desuccinylase-like protein
MIAARILQNAEPEPMEYNGLEYSVVQLTDDAGWRWEVRFADGKSKSGVTQISRASASQKDGVKLKGDLIVAGVVGEIEKAQVGRFQGKTYRGAGVGARYLMDHGVMADMCIIGEPTGLQLQIGNSGLLWARVSVDGKATKFVLAACKVAQAIQDWEKEYQRKYPHSFMLPTVQIGAIDGGNAFKPGTRPTTDIFVIVKMLPGTPPLALKREIEQVCENVRKQESDILDIRVDL